MAQKRGNAAIVTALAPICADKFRASTEAATNLLELKAVGVWRQGNFISEGGWATMRGSDVAKSAVADACATMISGAWWR